MASTGRHGGGRGRGGRGFRRGRGPLRHGRFFRRGGAWWPGFYSTASYSYNPYWWWYYQQQQAALQNLYAAQQMPGVDTNALLQAIAELTEEVNELQGMLAAQTPVTGYFGG